MKVCYVTHLPNLTGASQSLLDLLEGLKGTEVEPVVLLGRHGPLEKELRHRNVPYEVIRYANELKKDDSALHSFRKDALNVAAKRQVKNFLQKQNVDLVHNNSMFVGIGMECAGELSIPYIAHIRDYVEEDHGLRLEHPEEQSRRLQNAEAAIAVSQALAVAAEEKYGAPANGIIPLYDAVDLDRYEIPLSSRDVPLSHDTVELLLAGRVQPGKGQLDAVKAVAKLNEGEGRRYHLTLVGSVGDSAYMKSVQAEADQLGEEQVTILSFVDDLKELRSKTDIALVCSASEAMGRVTVESMLSGCLVVGASGGATPELLDGGRGFLYETGDVDDLVETIQTVSALLPEDVTSRLHHAQSFCQETFRPDRYANAILQIYREVL